MFQEKIVSNDQKILIDDKMLPLVVEVATYYAPYVSVYGHDSKLMKLPSGFKYGNFEYLSSLIYDENEEILKCSLSIDIDYDDLLFDLLSQIVVQFRSDFEKISRNTSVSMKLKFEVQDKILEICEYRIKKFYREQTEIEYENRKRYSDIAIDYTKKQLSLFWITIIYVIVLLYMLTSPSNSSIF